MIKLMGSNIVLFIFCLSMLTGSFGKEILIKRDIHDKDEEKEPLVFLTVSSLASNPEERDRMLEMNWHNVPQPLQLEDSRIVLYDHDPTESLENPLIAVIPHSEGYFRTGIQFPEQIFNEFNLSDECLGFWIVYLRNDELKATSCLRAHPHWMYQARSAIGRTSLVDLLIPGTHNAGSYKAFDPDDDNLFNRYLITQEESIWNQLVYGIRYLDLRVSYQSASNERFWITHGHFRTDVSIRDVLSQVKSFLNHTNEIIIMDFHRFVNGFSGRRASNRHRELISLLERELGSYIIPVEMTSWVTLNELWDRNKRLYIGYASNKERRQRSFLFPAIKHLWGDVDEVEELYQYLNRTLCAQRQQRLTSAMAQLTPTTTGAIFNLYGGLRNMADDVNRHVTKWFRDEWSHCVNIIATDYFLGNNIIETAIQVNRDRFSYSS